MIGGLFKLIPWWGKIAIALAVAASLYGGYRVWRHSIWEGGFDDAVEMIKDENAAAGKVAEKVQLTSDQCYEKGGWWDVIEDRCQLD